MSSIFQMHEKIVEDYKKYVQSFLSISDRRIRDFIEDQLVQKNSLWPDALIQVNPAYEPASTIEDLVQEGILHPTLADIFRDERDRSLLLYRHQVDAIAKGKEHRSFVVTSGTGSGKSLTYLIPIFDIVARSSPGDPKVRAIIVYPMNALVNSQYEALKRYAEGYEQKTGKPCPVNFRKYTGQENDEERKQIQQNPPHILLTNYVMLELMLIRPEEHTFVDATTSGMQFLVFDELHTYRGRQGADVALLIRRLRNRCGNPNLLCIGTSATMIAGRRTTASERKLAVANFASTIFGVPIESHDIIEETLQRVTKYPSIPSKGELIKCIAAPVPASRDAFLADPLTAWIESTFGIYLEEEGRYRRRVPISLKEGAALLAKETELPLEDCLSHLNQLFLAGSRFTMNGGFPLFGFKLHQFISQGRTIYSTIERPESRHLTLEGQYYAPGTEEKKLLYPLKFCRVCGQEYYMVSRNTHDYVMYPDDEQSDYSDEESTSGYLMLAVNDERSSWGLDDIPPDWIDAKSKKVKVKKARQGNIPIAVWVKPNGSFVDVSSGEMLEGGVKAWYQPKPFMLCQKCGEYYTARSQNDYRKLSGLATEGRSTCTTVLSLAAYQRAPLANIEGKARKILSFTDNRQDASLQAGHFNDFVQVSFLRGAIFKALKKDGQLKYDQIADKVLAATGLNLKDIASNPTLDEHTPKAKETWDAFRDLLEYRIYEDLQRGWRVVQPNLEQVGLLSFEYQGLDELCEKDVSWKSIEPMRGLTKEERKEVIKNILDFFRKKLAIRTECFDAGHLQQLHRQVYHNINNKWSLDFIESKPTHAGKFVLPGKSDTLLFTNSLGATSLIGRYLKRSLNINGDYRAFIEDVVNLLCSAGILVERKERGNPYFQVDAAVILWKVGDGSHKRDPIYSTKAEGPSFNQFERQANEYFSQFYQEIALSLKDVESREHTAQIKYENRAERETQFREGNLAALFCSPTMELGIDIADLQLVHLRNVPPTPANYAQRSGRAGRKGDPALVLTYCSAGSGHDQYFFHHRDQLVAGSVRAPRIDLGNEDLVRAHIHAIWLSYVRLSLGSSIDEIVDLGLKDYPLQENVKEQIQLSEGRLKKCFADVKEILARCGHDLAENPWYNDEWLMDVLRSAPRDFDAAFQRFRELFRSADQLWEEANNQMRIPSRDKDKMERARNQRMEAERQKNLLCNHTTKKEESDFYPYRYLGSEGFLPGYNFPRLPIRAFIPTASSQGEFISRPRFLAITEFGPQAFLYHEGAKYQVKRLTPPPGGLASLRREAKVCRNCGYFHVDRKQDLCENCGVALDATTSEIVSLLEMTNVRAVRRQRITSDEEERKRWGYQLSSHFRFAPGSDGKKRTIVGVVQDSATNPILNLTYAPAASLFRINHGWKIQREKSFYIDMATGDWMRTPDTEESDAEPTTSVQPEAVKLFVQDTMNLLLVNFASDEEIDESTQASFQYALQRGMEKVFQIDGSEIASERIGTGKNAAILFWEASEGGVGVLKRLVTEQETLRQVAAAALERCHFDPETLEEDATGKECSYACYECLLSYANQRDYRRLDRHLLPTLLSKLSKSTSFVKKENRNYDEQYRWLYEQTDSQSNLERQFLDHLHQTKRCLPDRAQERLADYYSEPDFAYEPNILIFCDGSVHDFEDQMRVDEDSRMGLKEKGYRVIVIRYDEELEEQIKAHPDIFGKGDA